MAAVAAFDGQVMDELLEAGHVLGLAGDVVEDLLFGDHQALNCFANLVIG